MSKKIQATITAFGAYLPKRILTNHDLEKMVETSDEWIVSRTGIQERRIAESDEYTSSMALKSAQDALAKIDFPASEVDAILVATMTPDFLCPSTAAIIQHQLGATKACALDIQAACSGFLYGLSIAKAWVESNAFKNVLVIAAEKNSAFIDYTDRNTCVIFGDGSGACLVQATAPKETSGYHLRHVCLGADGEQSGLLSIPAGASRMPATESTVCGREHYIKMLGKELFKHAVRRMESSSKECLEAAGVSEEEIRWIIPHQANIRIIEAIAKRFNIPWERVVRTIHKYGNTSSATIPITICDLEKEHGVESGQTILLTAFGGGLTWGSTILTKE